MSGEAAAVRNQYIWTEDDLPTSKQLMECEEQAFKMEGFAQVLTPYLQQENSGTGGSGSVSLGNVIGTMLVHQETLNSQSAEEMKVESERKAAEGMRDAP